MMTELSLSCDEIHLLSRPLSQHTHLKQGSLSEISRDPVAPLLRTVTAGENALWEIHDSGEIMSWVNNGRKPLKRLHLCVQGGLANSSGNIYFFRHLLIRQHVTTYLPKDKKELDLSSQMLQ